MEKKTKTTLAGVIVAAVVVAGALSFIVFQGQNENLVTTPESININIYVEGRDWGVNYSNESLNLEVKEGDYFGVPSLSGFAYIDNGSKIFKLIEVIDSEHAKVWFNESMLANYTWINVTTWNYLENPLIVSTNATKFIVRHLIEWIFMDPYPFAEIYLSIVESG